MQFFADSGATPNPILSIYSPPPRETRGIELFAIAERLSYPRRALR